MLDSDADDSDADDDEEEDEDDDESVEEAEAEEGQLELGVEEIAKSLAWAQRTAEARGVLREEGLEGGQGDWGLDQGLEDQVRVRDGLSGMSFCPFILRLGGVGVASEWADLNSGPTARADECLLNWISRFAELQPRNRATFGDTAGPTAEEGGGLDS